VGNDGERTVQDFRHEFEGFAVPVDVGRVQFEGPPDPGEQRNHDDAHDEERCDTDALGAFNDVGHRGVDELTAMVPNPMVRLGCFPRRAESATATAPEVISTRTPVAYAPPWASTSALNSQVIRNPTAVNARTSGRTARAHPEAMP
jgi:hypothetical protein